MALSVKISDVEKAVQNLLTAGASAKEKRKALRKSAKPVVETARRLAPQSMREHYRYLTPKLSSRLRAPKGKGVKVAAYKPGHLAGSIRTLALRRAVAAIVGPKRARTAAGARGEFGPATRRFDAYYAQMVFGSAKRFRDKITGAALQQSRGQVIRILEDEYRKVFIREGKKNGFRV